MDRTKRKAGTPFIMPDGRPLGLFLVENNLLHGDKPASKKGKKRPGAIRVAKDGWTKPLASKAAVAAPRTPGATSGGGAYSDAEAMELEALARVGQRRRRRFLNDKLLRDMAGTLTARDMEALFKPVPFGETGYVSLFSQATSREYVEVWDLFRSVDMDKESRVLKKWEAHVRELQQGPHAIASPAIHALAAWSGVSWKARKAMKRANPSHVEELEARLLGFVDEQRAQQAQQAQHHHHAAEGEGSTGGSPPSSELVLDLEDGFHRLIGHGLAEFHGIGSFSRAEADGTKRLVLRCRRGAALPPPATITCCDILALLEDKPEHGLNTRVLDEAYCHPAGDADQLVPQMALVAVQ